MKWNGFECKQFVPVQKFDSTPVYTSIFFLARATQRVTIRLPGASEYHNGQVNVLSYLPDWARCPAFSGLCLCFHCQRPGLYSTKAG